MHACFIHIFIQACFSLLHVRERGEGRDKGKKECAYSGVSKKQKTHACIHASCSHMHAAYLYRLDFLFQGCMYL